MALTKLTGGGAADRWTRRLCLEFERALRTAKVSEDARPQDGTDEIEQELGSQGWGRPTASELMSGLELGADHGWAGL